ncbi:MAG: 5'/3'-nucleotidase SurE, partial [Reyranella sp.]|nr:5'/3'-nucleotidase SurE [Reyranella sp.]
MVPPAAQPQETPPQKPRVLLVNDDGIHAAGILLLEELVRQYTDDVWVVAPAEERSGASHAISLTTPVRMRQLGERKFAVYGTPTDCVLLGYWHVLKDQPPTVLISGINHGENLAEDVTYSGTASAAMEGALLGMRSIAMSQVYHIHGGQPRWDTARQHGAAVLGPLLTCPWEPGVFVNVNFPDVAPDQVSGIRLTTQGQRMPGSFKPIARIDGRNVPYYWIKIEYDPGAPVADTDLDAMRHHAVSVTPMHIDLTAHRFNKTLQSAFK